MYKLKEDNAQFEWLESFFIIGYQYVQDLIIGINRSWLKLEGGDFAIIKAFEKITAILRFEWSKEINWVIKRGDSKERFNVRSCK